MATEDKKPEDQKNMAADVAKPGTTPASATSRPIIVSRTAAVSDPMVSSTPAQPEKPAPAADVAVSSGSMKPRIEPTKAAQEVLKDATKESDEANADEPIEKVEATDKQARLGEIIESGEYNVSIKQKNASINAVTFIVTVLSIVLVAVVVVFLLTDLKIIDLGIKLPFELFK